MLTFFRCHNVLINLAHVRSVGFERREGVPAVRLGYSDGMVYLALDSPPGENLCAAVLPDMTREEIMAEFFGGDDAEPGPVRKPSKGGGPKPRAAARKLEPVGGPVGYW